MKATSNFWLMAAAIGSLAASILHLACIAGGPSWYRRLGAGEEMVRMASQGSWIPVIVIFAIAMVLAVWSAYAFSGAGLVPRLPLVRTGLVLISVVLMLRAAAFFFRTNWRPDLSFDFMLWSSAIALALGTCFAIGTARAWVALTTKAAS